MKRLGITTDCVCDLPDEYLRLHDVELMYFYITTETGRFKDVMEVTAENILDHLDSGGKKAETNAPAPEEYKGFFENSLKNYDELIHISISGHISDSSKNASAALELMGDNGKKIHVIDSEHLSTGMGHIVIKAVEMRDGGSSAEEIIAALGEMKSKVSTSFIAMSADYLYRNGRVSKKIRDLVSLLNLHPILCMKNGRMTLKGVEAGNPEKAVLRYIKKELKNKKNINAKRIFITHAYCSVKNIADVKAAVEKYCSFDEIIVTKASATVSGNCGPGTVGVLYVFE